MIHSRSYIWIIFLLPIGIWGTPLSIDQFIQKIITETSQVKRLHSHYKTKTIQTKAPQQLLDWNMNTSSSLTRGTDVPGFSAYGNDNIYGKVETSLSHLHYDSGIQIQYSAGYTQSTNAPELFPNISNPDIYQLQTSLTLSKPLMDNSNGNLNRIPFQIAAHQDSLFITEFEIAHNQLISKFITVYENWYLAKNKLNIIKKQVNKATEQRIIVQKMRQKGIRDKADLIQAQQNEAQKILQAKQSQHQYNQITLAIHSILEKDIQKESQYTPESPIFSKWLSPITSEWLVQRINETFPLILLHHTHKIQTLTLQKNKEQQKPNLDMFISKSINSKENTLDKLIPKLGKNGSISVGINYYNFAHSTQEGLAVQETQRKLINTQLDQNETKRQLTLQLQQLMESLQTIDHTITQLKKILNLSKSYAKIQYTKYQQGRLDSQFFLFQAQDYVLEQTLQLENQYSKRRQILNQIHTQIGHYKAPKKTLK